MLVGWWKWCEGSLHLSSLARIEPTHKPMHHDGFAGWFQTVSTCFKHLDRNKYIYIYTHVCVIYIYTHIFWHFHHVHPYGKISDMWSQLNWLTTILQRGAGNMLKHLATVVCFCFVGRFPVPTGLAIRCSCCSVAGEVASPQTARSAWPLRKPIRTRSTMTWCRRRHTFHGEDGRSGGKASEA